MTDAVLGLMSFNVRLVESDVSGTRWHWTVYGHPSGFFARDGQVTGDRDKVERAARAAMAIMGARTSLSDVDEDRLALG